MRLVILLVLMVLIDLYAFQAIRNLVQNSSTTVRQISYGIFWLLALFSCIFVMAQAFGFTPALPENLVTYLQASVLILYLGKVLAIPVLLIDDVIRLMRYLQHAAGEQSLPLDNSRSRFLVRTASILGALPIFTLSYGMLRNPYRYTLFRKTIDIPRLPANLAGLKIVQISDIHSGSFTFKEPVKRAVEMINAQKPDLVLFTGDIVNERSDEMLDYTDVFDKIEAKHGVYAVLGNHDYGDYAHWNNEEEKAENMQQLRDIHRRMGWILLENEHEILNIRGEQVAILGVENYSVYPRFPKLGDLSATYAGTEVAPLKILLSHDPSYWDAEVVPQFKDVQLTLSGHTHGMQFGVEIPGFIKWSPIRFMYRQWAGLYQRGDQFLYVNRGLGFLGYPGRVGILPEITVLELQPAGSTS